MRIHEEHKKTFDALKQLQVFYRASEDKNNQLEDELKRVRQELAVVRTTMMQDPRRVHTDADIKEVYLVQFCFI